MFAANPQPQGNANIGQNVNNNDPNDEAMIFPDLSSEGVTGESTTSSPSPAPLILGGGTAGPISGFGSTPALARGSSQAESFRSDPSEIIAATPLSQRAAPIAFGLASGTSSFQAPISLTAFDDTVVNSPVAIPTVESEPELEPEPGPEPEPEPEPPVEASAQPDVGSVTIGQTLTQQTGILVNDEGDGKTLTTVNGVTVTSNGQTTIVGKYGTLNIQADGTYTYDATNIDIHSDLAAHWTFDDTVGSTQAHDVSNVDRFTDTGTLHNNAAIVSGGVSGNALQLDGTGDYVSVPRSSELAAPQGGVIGARTISLSFRPTRLEGIQVLYSEAGEENGGFEIAIENGTLTAGTYSSEPGAGGVLEKTLTDNDLNQWHNITLSLDETAGTLEAWFDGTSLDVRTNIQGINTGSSSDIELGRAADDFYFDGMIDEVRVYNRALNQQEVNVLLADTNPVSESFTYTIEDSSGGTSSSTLDITLTEPANNIPVAKDDFLSVTSDQNIAVISVAGQGVLGNDGDPDGEALTVTHIGNTEVASSGTTTVPRQLGSLSIAPDGTYAYTVFSSASAGGVETFAYTVSDGTTTSTANLRVTLIPDGMAKADSITVTESALPADSVYVIVKDSGRESLAILDTKTGTTHLLERLSGDILYLSPVDNGLSMGPDGVLYGTNTVNLYTIDPATQTVTVIGAHGVSTNVSTSALTGLTIAPDGTIYGGASNGRIYSLNSVTGLATELEVTTGFDHFFILDLIWHVDALYASVDAYSNQYSSHYQYSSQIVRIESSANGLTIIPAANAFDGGDNLGALMSIDGELKVATENQSIMTIDTTTGLLSENFPDINVESNITDASLPRAASSGNLLENDAGAEFVTAIALPDGPAISVGNGETILQGIYGTLIIQSDGSYIYTLDDGIEATSNLNSGEIGGDRFIYTAANQAGETSQSIFTVSVNGADDYRVGSPDEDTLIGGAGNNILTGGEGMDLFVWSAADIGTSRSPAYDTITDFTTGSQGDILDLRDLLPDSTSNTLDEFLSFSFADGDTTISASLSAGGSAVQHIVLTNVDLSSLYGTTDATQLTNQLTDDGNLLV